MELARSDGKAYLSPMDSITTYADSGGSRPHVHHCKVVCLLYLHILERREARPEAGRPFPWPPPSHGMPCDTCCATWSMSPSCPWISWDKSRSRVTGLLDKTCRLKNRLIKLLQNDASSRRGEEGKFHIYGCAELTLLTC